MQVSLFVEGLQTDDDFCKDLGSLVQGENFVGKFSLVVHQISSVAELSEQVDEVFVLLHIVQLDDVWRLHAPHALNFAFQVTPQVRFGFDHFD